MDAPQSSSIIQRVDVQNLFGFGNSIGDHHMDSLGGGMQNCSCTISLSLNIQPYFLAYKASCDTHCHRSRPFGAPHQREWNGNGKTKDSLACGISGDPKLIGRGGTLNNTLRVVSESFSKCIQQLITVINTL